MHSCHTHCVFNLVIIFTKKKERKKEKTLDDDRSSDMNQTFEPNCSSSEPYFLSLEDLNRLVCDLKLKKQGVLRGSRLKACNTRMFCELVNTVQT